MTHAPFLDALERELRDAHPRRRAARRRAAARRAARNAPVAVVVAAALAGGLALTGALDGSPEAPVPREPAGTAPALQGVRVAVLNGTTTTGLARAVGDRLAAAGATVGTLTSAPDPRTAVTRVLHEEGARPQARTVAALLDASIVEPLRPEVRALVEGEAAVVVVAGDDLAAAAPPAATVVGCPGALAEQTARTAEPWRDAIAGPLAILGARQTPGRARDAFDRRGYKLGVTVADGRTASLVVPRALWGRVGLVYSLDVQRAVLRDGIRLASDAVRFTACAQGGESPRTGWPGGIVTDRPRCATLHVRVDGEQRVRRLPVPLGRRC